MGVQQISLWESVYETFKPKKIRLYQFFAGIGAQAQAFKELGLDFEDYKIAEWSVPSIKAYNAIHKKDYTDYSQGKSREDMIQIVKNVSLDYNQPISEKQLNSKSDEWVRDVYNNIIATNNLVNICNVKGSDLEINTSYTNIIFYSFPCQDLSKAGLRKGLNAERSGLLWEIERILKQLTDEERKSCVLICENVPDLVEVNFVKDFSKWVQQLENLGFTSYDQILNAKDYGVPQNRRRVFMVSLPGAYSYVFPRKMQLEYHLKDFLQEKPDNKYFLSQRIIDFFIANTEKQKLNGNGFTFDPMDEDDAERIGKTITTRAGSRMDDNFVIKNKRLGETLEEKEIEDADFIDTYNRAVKKGIAGTITTRTDASNNTFIAVKNNNAQGYALAKEGDGIDISGRMQFHRGTVQKGCSQTLSTMGDNDVGVAVQKEKMLIRKLTPTECMRLMGFNDDATNSMKEIGMTDSQIYHVAGDSIVVSVLMGIFGQLLGIDYEPKIRELTKRLAESK
jgi:DNA (cytosine-5)-methyltransferase 1